MRLLSWNVHGAVGLDRRYDLERVARAIRACSPQVMALQEVDSRGRAAAVDPFEFLSADVGFHRATAHTLSAADGHYGQMLVSRWPLERQRIHDVSVSDREPRRVIDCRVAHPAGPVRVLAVHFGLLGRERRRQLQHLLAIVARGGREPTVIMGDFNEWQPFGPIRRALRNAGFAGTRTRSFPAWLPALALDRIWVRPAHRLAAPDTIVLDHRASDHRAVYAELTLPA